MKYNMVVHATTKPCVSTLPKFARQLATLFCLDSTFWKINSRPSSNYWISDIKYPLHDLSIPWLDMELSAAEQSDWIITRSLHHWWSLNAMPFMSAHNSASKELLQWSNMRQLKKITSPERVRGIIPAPVLPCDSTYDPSSMYVRFGRLTITATRSITTYADVLESKWSPDIEFNL